MMLPPMSRMLSILLRGRLRIWWHKPSLSGRSIHRGESDPDPLHVRIQAGIRQSRFIIEDGSQSTAPMTSSTGKGVGANRRC